MLSHSRIWSAIDRLAERNGMSASGLAKRSGLDSTAFNPSKRFSNDGRPRWPSTESVSKVLQATGSSLEELLDFIGNEPGASQSGRLHAADIPVIGFAQAGKGGYFDDAGFPAGDGWDRISVPGQVGQSAFALEVQGDSMLPLYKHGGILVIDPEASIRQGDRVVVRTQGGEVTAKTLQRRTAKVIELMSLNPDHPARTFAHNEIVWMARVVWASQ